MKVLAAGVVVALASAASADVTVTFTNLQANGFQFFSMYQVGELSGTLTGVTVDAVLNSSVAGTTADDLCLYLTPTNSLALNGRLQIGGFSNLGAQSRYFWDNGDSSLPGTPVDDFQDLVSENINAAGFRFWLGNGYGFTGTSGNWTGEITLHGVEVVPGPGAVGVLAVGGLLGRRRRRSH